MYLSVASFPTEDSARQVAAEGVQLYPLLCRKHLERKLALNVFPQPVIAHQIFIGLNWSRDAIVFIYLLMIPIRGKFPNL